MSGSGPWLSPPRPAGGSAYRGAAAFPLRSPPRIGFRARPRQLSEQIPPRRSRSSAALNDPIQTSHFDETCGHGNLPLATTGHNGISKSKALPLVTATGQPGPGNGELRNLGSNPLSGYLTGSVSNRTNPYRLILRDIPHS